MSSSSNLQESYRGDQLDVCSLAKLVSVLGGPKDETVRAGKHEYSDRLSKGLQLDHSSKQSIEKTVRWLESARLALDGISRFIVEEIATLQDALPCANVQYAGLQDLPDEVLLMIMERTVLVNWPPTLGQSCRRWDGAMTLSHVCRRFRAVALNSPILWTHLKSTKTIDKTRAFLERSNEHELDIYLCDSTNDEDYGQTELEDFLGAVLEHCHRWKSFEVQLVGYYGEIVTFLSSVTSICGHQTLPILRTFVLRSVSHCGELTGLDDEDGIHFYANWTLPMLEVVVLHNFVARPAHMISHPLQALEICCCNGEEEEEPVDISNLLGVLRSQPLLKRLKIQITNLELYSNESKDPVELHDLSSLELNLSTNLQNTALLMSSLSFPNLTKFDAITEVTDWRDIPVWLNYVLCGPNSLSGVETINFGISHCGYNSTCGFREVLRLPNLYHLSIGINDEAERFQDLWYKHYDLREGIISPLRSLRFSGCESFRGSNLTDILECLKSRRQLNNFRRLEVDKCPSFRKKDAERLLPQSKIVWTD